MEEKINVDLLIPIILTGIKYPIYPEYFVPYNIVLWWVAPYNLIGVLLLIYAYFIEGNPLLKRNRVFTNLIFVPPILFGLTTNFILRGIGIDNAWRSNTVIVLDAF